MKQKHLAALLRDDMTTVRVVYNNEVAQREGAMGIRNYTYMILKQDAPGLKPDDQVVVPTSGKYGATVAVATIMEVHEEPQIDADADYEYKWVIQKIDFERYNAIVAHEKEMQSVLASAEKAVKRRTLMETYQQMLAGTATGKRLADLAKGPALPAPAVGPKTTFDKE